MNTLKQILEKERTNVSSIYLYLEGEVWYAYGKSAQIISAYLPSVSVSRLDLLDTVIAAVPFEKAIVRFENQLALASDDYIEIRLAPSPKIDF